MSIISEVEKLLELHLQRLQREEEFPVVDYPFGYGLAFIELMQSGIPEEDFNQVVAGIKDGLEMFADISSFNESTDQQVVTSRNKFTDIDYIKSTFPNLSSKNLEELKKH